MLAAGFLYTAMNTAFTTYIAPAWGLYAPAILASVAGVVVVRWAIRGGIKTVKSEARL